MRLAQAMSLQMTCRHRVVIALLWDKSYVVSSASGCFFYKRVVKAWLITKKLSQNVPLVLDPARGVYRLADIMGFMLRFSANARRA